MDRNSIEPLCCRIHTVTLLESPAYEALSYTWGKIVRHLPISVTIAGESVEDEKALFATPQLIMALKRLRFSSGSRFLWIDQLCIDQENDEEKGPQIQLMADIYKKANRVVMWLGEDPEHFVYEPVFGEEADSELIGDMIKIFAESPVEILTEDLRLARVLIDVRPLTHRNSIEQRRLTAILEVLNRPWFRRAWVFQEASLAQKLQIQYGSLEVQFEDFKRVIDAVSALEWSTGVQKTRSLAADTGGFEMIQHIYNARQGLVENPSGGLSYLKGSKFLTTLFSILRRVEAFDARDLIFAFLAFQEDEGIIATAESYGQTQGEVWQLAAERIIITSQSLDIFAALSGDKERELKLPSWVPYWSDCFPYSRPIATPASRFKASRDRPHIWQTPDESHKLRVRGKIIDSINEFLGWQFGKFASWKHSTHMFLAWDILRQSTNRYLYGKSAILGDQLAVKLGTVDKDLMRTVLADGAMGMQQPLRCLDELLDVNKTADKWRELRNEGRRDDLSEEQKNDLGDYEKLEHLALVAELKQVFITDNIQLGLVPQAARIGDHIAIVHGSKVPCVLREVEGASGEYRIISQCYLDGWMYGKTPNDRPHPHSKWWEEKEDEFVLV